MSIFRIKTLLILFLFSFGISSQIFAQRGMPFSIVKTFEKNGASKEKMFKKIVKWINALDRDVRVIRFNENECMAEAEGVLSYVNSIVIENIFLSPNAALRTKGTITFAIKMFAEDGRITVEFTNFTHEAYANRYGKISFGTILTNDKVPLDKCYENTQWCNAVWDDMKSKVRRHVAELWSVAEKKMD